MTSGTRSAQAWPSGRLGRHCRMCRALVAWCAQRPLAALSAGRDLGRCSGQRLPGPRHASSRRRRRAAHTTVASDASDASAPSVLFLSPVWPERSSSAAGVRTSDLLESFQRRGWAAAYASASSPNDHTAALEAAGVATFACPPNRQHQLEQVLAEVCPTAVVFDRFYAEEAFSFRVRELAPGALRVLDMQVGWAVLGGLLHAVFVPQARCVSP